MRRILVAAAVIAVLAGLAVWSAVARAPDEDVEVAIEPASEEAPPPPTPRAVPSSRRRSEVALPSADAGVETSAERPDGISILLLDVEGDPLPGRTLAAYWVGEGVEMEVRGATDAAGLLATPIGSPDRLEAVVLEEADATLHADGPFEPAPDRPGVVVVRCPRSARVEGVVRDEQGRTVANARVEIEPQPVLGLDPHVESFLLERVDAETDAYGRYEVALAEGCYALAPSAEGFDATEVALPCLAAGATALVDLALQGSDREVEVEVRAGGKPLQEPVLVTAARAADAASSSAGILRDRIAIERGCEALGGSLYAARISLDGSWTIAVTLARGFEDARVAVEPADERIVVELRPREPGPSGAAVRGTVSTASGAPLSAEVVLFHGANLDWASIARSDEAGRFAIEIDPREKEPLFLLAREPGYGAAGAGPIEPARIPGSIDLVLGAERTIAGVVVGPGGSEVPARLSLHPARGFFAPLVPTGERAAPGFLDEAATAETGEGGAFAFRGLSDGEYEIRARAREPGSGLPPGCVVAVAGEVGLRIELGAGLERYATLAGIVREAGSGRPIAGARVAAGLARGGMFRTEDSITGEDGRYALRGCPAEVLELFVDAPGQALRDLDVGPFPAGEHALDLEVFPERTLRLLVVDPSGTPAPGTLVAASDARGRPLHLRDGGDLLATDLAGRVDLHGLPAAEVLVTVGRRGEDDPFVVNAAYLAPDSSQPEPQELRFDLRIPLEGIPRVVIPR